MRVFGVAPFLLVPIILLCGCSRKKEVRSVQMGEKAEIGTFIYRAIETRWPMTLEGRVAKDRFFIVHVTVVNSGSNPASIPGFEVVNDQGNSFPETVDGSGVENWLGVSRKLPPAETEQGNIVFDVPPKHYRLRVADETDEFMYIDIPLNLDSEQPESKGIDIVVPVK